MKRLQPEELAFRIRDFDQDVCTQVFLSELRPVLPNPEQVHTHRASCRVTDAYSVLQVGKLNIYRNADPEELAGLHPSDRLMVQLIKIDRLGPRIEGMLYKVVFDETWTLLDDVSRVFGKRYDQMLIMEQSARKLSEAGKSLLDAKHFKELLSVSCDDVHVYL